MSTRYGICLALLCVCGLIACTDEDKEVFGDVGVVRILLVDTAVRNQYQLLLDEKVDITSADLPASGAQWKVTGATVTVGDHQVDTLFGNEACVFTILAPDVLPFISGPCTNGFVVNAAEPVFSLSIEVTIAGAQLLRASPADRPGCLPDEPDPENPDESDGDCDNDGILDLLDICAWLPAVPPADPDGEPTHLNTVSFEAEPITDSMGRSLDGIGDECQQDARNVEGTFTFPASLPAFSPLLDSVSYVVIDVSSDRILSAPRWGPGAAPGSFEVMDGAIEVCQANSLFAALAGCP